jgi:ATP-dependent Lon protease
MGIHTVLVPARNDKDVRELPATVRRGMNFVFADHMDQVLEVALAKGARRKRRLQVALSAKPGSAPPRHLTLTAVKRGHRRGE